MFHFLEIDIREQKKYEKRMQTSVDDTMSNLHCEIKFENHVKDKNTTFLLSETFNKYIFFLETFFFFLWQILKNIEMPQLELNVSNAAPVKRTD